MVTAGAMLLVAANNMSFDDGNQSRPINAANAGFALTDSEYYYMDDNTGDFKRIHDMGSWSAMPGDTIERRIGIDLTVEGGTMSTVIDLNDFALDANESKSSTNNDDYGYSVSITNNDGEILTPVSSDNPLEFEVVLTDDQDSLKNHADSHQEVVLVSTLDGEPEFSVNARIALDESIESHERMKGILSQFNKSNQVSMTQTQ